MKISTTNMRRKDGSKLVNGYKITLQKSEVEKIGMDETTELVPIFEDGKITLIEAYRYIFARIEPNNKVILYLYQKLAENVYKPKYYSLHLSEDDAKAFARSFKKEDIIPRFYLKNYKIEEENQ